MSFRRNMRENSPLCRSRLRPRCHRNENSNNRKKIPLSISFKSYQTVTLTSIFPCLHPRKPTILLNPISSDEETWRKTATHKRLRFLLFSLYFRGRVKILQHPVRSRSQPARRRRVTFIRWINFRWTKREFYIRDISDWRMNQERKLFIYIVFRYI